MSPTTRREFLKDAALAGAAISTSSLYAQTNAKVTGRVRGGAVRAVELRLLDKAAGMAAGVSWGVPWPQGAVARGTSFQLISQQTSLPLQSWPLAYWPDGSMKWSGFATVAAAGMKGPMQIVPSSGETDRKGMVVNVTDGADVVTIDTGKVSARTEGGAVSD